MFYYLGRLHDTWRAFGTGATCHFLCDRLLARTIRLDVQTIAWLDARDVRVGPESKPAFGFRFLSADEVAVFAREPEHHLTPDFPDRIRRGRDFCYAALTPDQRLAAYTWYAIDGIEPEHSAGAGLELPQGVAYAYKNFTLPSFRGGRLHGAALGGALRALRGRGVTSLVALVHWTNQASLRSFRRLGSVELGHLWSWGAGRSRRVHAPAPDRVRGVRFGAYCRRPAFEVVSA